MSVSRGTVHSIQFLRFVAATLVVLFHAHLGVTTRVIGGVAPAEAYLFGFGKVGVHIFFVISGYIMYLTNVARPEPFSAPRFFTRRLIRVYPIYWIFALAYLAVEIPLALAPALAPGQLVGALLLWPADAPLVIGPAWTLSFELYFYFAFGLAMMLGRRLGLWALTAAFLLSIVIGAATHPSTPLGALATSGLLLEFVAGVWIARVTSTVALPRMLGWLSLALALAGFAAGLAWGYDRLSTAIVWGVPSALLIAGAVILEQTAPTRARAGPIRRLSVLGDSSYSLYLGHLLLVTLATYLLAQAGVLPLPVPVAVAITLVAIGVAHGFYLIVERPLVRRLHRLTERGVRPQPRPAGTTPVR